ncbi:MAG: hypothetical protein ACLP22_25495 [Solirubrobacteraceae bacterium]
MTTPSKVIPVGSMWSNNGVALKTLAVNPTTAGDILVLATASSTTPDLVTAVSGGGVTTWTELIYALPSGSGSPGSTSLWWGVITSPGPSTITITTSATYFNFLVCQQFTMGGAGVWTADGSAASTSTASVVSGTMPSVTPSTTGPELYIGALMSASTGGTGADPNVVYEGTGTVAITGGNYGLLFLYNPNAGLPLAEAPAWCAPLPYEYAACSALIIAERPFYAPLAPTLLSPPATAHIDATQVWTFSALYNANDSWPMSAYALRLKIVGGAYAYWNAVTQALQPAEVWNAVTPAVANGGTISVVLPAYTLLNGLSYDFSFATQESGADLDGPFATDVAFTAQAAPVVTVTAPAAIAVGTATPTVSWSNVLAPGTSQTGYEIVVESGSYATGPGAAPGSGTQVYDSGVVSSAALSAVTGTLAQPGLYCAFVRITETGSEVSAWGSSVFVCEASAPPTPTWVSATACNDPTTGTPRVTLVISTADTGFAGQCYLAVLRSDGAYVRGAGWPTGVCQAIPSGGGSLTLYDYETVPGTAYTYTAQVLAFTPIVSAVSSASASVTTGTNNAWFILDPTNVATAAQFFPGTLTFVDHEAATTFEPLGTRGTLIKSGAGVKGRQGSIAAGVVTQAAYQQLRAVLLNTGTLLLQGPLEQQYVTAFGDRSGALTPTTAAAPSGNYWDVITFVTVEQTRP